MIKKIVKHCKEYGLLDTIHWLNNCLHFKFLAMSSAKADFKDIQIGENEKQFLTPKNLPSIYIVALIPFYDIGGGQRCSQLAKTFNNLGFPVHYLYAYKSGEKKRIKMPIPTSSHIFIDENIENFLENKVKNDDLFIFEAPSSRFKKVLNVALKNHCKILYENIDNWETSLGQDIYDEEILISLLNNAELLVGTAKPLVVQLKNYLKKYKIKNKQILYLPNAVDTDLFNGMKKFDTPNDLIKGDKTFLYYGSLWGEWFDWQLLEELARKYPACAFNIIGDDGKLGEIKKALPNNIYFLGLKPQKKLPEYLKACDYAMIPFKPGKISDYVSPLKIFEYISMYAITLCTDLPDIENYPNVYRGNTADEWSGIIEKDYAIDKRAADEFTTKNSWNSRISQMIDFFYPVYNESVFYKDLSVIVLNYNNKNVIFKCVDSLIEYKKHYEYEIIVVDNGSTDGSYEKLQKMYGKSIKLVKNSRNGCSSGRNLGVSVSKSNYILFLDSDQFITSEYWLLSYEKVMKEHPDFGLIGWSGGFFNREGGAYHIVDSFPFKYMPPNSLCRYDVSYLATCGMLMTRELFDKIDGFDINYDPTCYEDSDLSMKVRDADLEIFYCPYLGLVHLPHQTTKSGSEEHSKLIRKKQQYFTKKWKEKNPTLFKYIK